MTSKSGSDDSGNELLMDSDGDIWTERYQRWIAPEDLSIIISLELRLANHKALFKEVAMEAQAFARHWSCCRFFDGNACDCGFTALEIKLRSIVNEGSEGKT